MNRGVFWLICGKLFAFPFDGSYPEGIAKSGNTYNHKKLWDSLKPAGRHVPFDYYLRGRVEITAQNVPVIYMSPHIGTEWSPQIMLAFEIPTVRSIVSVIIPTSPIPAAGLSGIIMFRCLRQSE